MKQILFFALLVLPVNTFAIHNTAIVNVEVARDVSAPSGSFTASLTGDQEVPALTTSASGTAALTWDSRGLHYRIPGQRCSVNCWPGTSTSTFTPRIIPGVSSAGRSP